MRYIMTEDTLKNKGTDVLLKNTLVTENIDKILMLISNKDLDSFSVAMQLTLPSQIEYYYVNFRNKSYIKTEANKISNNIKTLIDKIMSLDGITEVQIKQTMEVERMVDETLRPIYTFLNEGKAKGDFYHRQMALGQENVILLINILVNMLISFEADKTGGQTDSTHAMTEAIKRIANICEDNFTNQSLLFQGISGQMFRQLNQKKPLLGIMALRFIFEKNNTILYVSPDVFELIISRYRQLIKEFFDDNGAELSLSSLIPKTGDPSLFEKNSVEYKRVGKLQALYSYNIFIEKVITLHKVSNVQKRPYDLEVQSMITHILSKHILKLMSDKLNWQSSNRSYQIGSKLRTITDMMMNGFIATLEQNEENKGDVFNLVQNGRLEKEDLRSALFELCYSFLKIYNKMTKRLVFVSHFTEIRQYAENLSNYSYLTEFKEGIKTMIEVVKFFNSFKIFYGDKMIGLTRYEIDKYAGVVFLEKFVPPSHYGTDISKYFGEMCKDLSKMGEGFATAGKDQKGAIQEIVYKGFLAGIYKYLKGVSSLIFFDAKIENATDVEAISKEVERVMDVVRLNAELINNLTDGNFQGKDSILNFTAPHPETYREKDRMELSDRLHDSLYNIRVRSELCIRAVLLSMPKNMEYLISSYERPSEIKPRDISIYIKDKDVHVDKKKKSVVGTIKLDLNQSMFLETKPNPKPTSGASNSHFSEYTKLMELYLKKKERQLDKRGIENILIYFFEENQQHIKTVLAHCL